MHKNYSLSHRIKPKRTVKVRHLYGVGENSASWESRNLDEFVFMHSRLGFALDCFKVMPTLSVLNDVFNQPESDGGMGGGVEWKPFAIDVQEYSELVEVLWTDPKRAIVIDEELNKINSFAEWSSKALSKYNPRKRVGS